MGQLPVSGIKSNMLKVVIFSALVAATWAAPVADGPPAYGPPHPVEKLPPQPFAYQYGVKDDYSGASFDKSESQSADGTVAGEYRVALPDAVPKLLPIRLTTTVDLSLMSNTKAQLSTPLHPPADMGHTNLPAHKLPQKFISLRCYLFHDVVKKNNEI